MRIVGSFCTQLPAVLQLLYLEHIGVESDPSVNIKVVCKIAEIPVHSSAGDMFTIMDTVFRVHGKVRELIRAMEVIGLKTLITVLFSPNAAQCRSLIEVSYDNLKPISGDFDVPSRLG